MKKKTTYCLMISIVASIVTVVAFSYGNYSKKEKEIPVIEVYSTYYSNSLDEKGCPLSDICWKYISTQEQLKALSEIYSFQCPPNLDTEKHSYVISFGCKVLAFYSQKRECDFVLNITYASEYEGKKIFLYQLPNGKLPFSNGVSYIIKDGEKHFFSSDCNSGDKALISNYKFNFSFPIKEVYSTPYFKTVSENGLLLPKVSWQYLQAPGYLEDVLSRIYSFQCPTKLEMGEYSYIVSFGCKVLECWTDEMMEEDYVLNVTFDSHYQGEQVFIYQLPKIKIYPLSWTSYIMKNEKRVFFTNVFGGGDLDLLEPQ